MDPTKIFKPKHEDALAPPSRIVSSSGAPRIFGSGGGGGSGSQMRFHRSSSSRQGDCSYWSIFQQACRNGECKETQQKFRQCQDQPREMAVIDPQTEEEKWEPVADEEEEQEDLFTGLVPPSFTALGSAVDDLALDVLPELQRMEDSFRARMNEVQGGNPWRALGGILDDLQLPGPLVPPAFRRDFGLTPSRHTQQQIPPSDPSSRPQPRLPTDNGLRNPAYPHPRDLVNPPSSSLPSRDPRRSAASRDEDDDSNTSPLSNIGKSVQGFAEKITGILGGHASTKNTKQQRRDDTDDDDSDRE